ncbi:MAG TPA: enoyl-CoA hydratase/isomerase family protein [Bacteroidota bacterium]|nr:enoyl-CoA hydratase/isomerase family protein [Bacteroidota bacterium]
MGLVALEQHNRVVIIRLNNGVTNAVSPALAIELSDLLGKIRNEFEGMLLAGGGKFFCIGFDVPKLLELDRSGLRDLFYRYNRILLDLFTMPKPTACAVKGHCLGAGETFLLTCDYRFGAAGKTLIGLNEIKLGLPVPYLPDMLLREIVGDRIASDMLYTGDFIGSTEAERVGILHEVLPKEEVEGRALEKLTELCKRQPKAFAAVKANRVEVIRSRYEKKYEAKIEELLDCWYIETTQELLREGAKKF